MMRQRFLGIGRAFARSVSGNAAVETAVVLPVFLLMVFGIMEFGRAYWIWNTVQLAVGDANRYAMVFNTKSCPTSNPTGYGPASSCCQNTLANCAVTYAKSHLYDVPSSAVTVTATTGTTTTSNGATISTLTISGSYTFDFIVPNLLPFGPFTLTTQSTVPLI